MPSLPHREPRGENPGPSAVARHQLSVGRPHRCWLHDIKLSVLGRGHFSALDRTMFPAPPAHARACPRYLYPILATATITEASVPTAFCSLRRRRVTWVSTVRLLRLRSTR